MRSRFLEYLMWWGPYVVALLAVAYSAIVKAAKDGSEDRSADSREHFGLAILGLVAIVIAMVLIGFLSSPKDLSWRFALVFLMGGAMSVAAFLYSLWRSGSPLAASGAVFFGVGLSLLGMAFLRNYLAEAPTVYLLVAALGAWFAAAVTCYGGTAAPALGARSAALAATAIAAAVALGVFRYPRSGIGSLFAVDICALALLLALVGAVIVGVVRTRLVGALAAAVVLLGGTWWLGSMLGNVVIEESTGGLCALVGVAVVLVLYWLAAASGESEDHTALLGRSEVGALAVLLIVAGMAISMRWLGGYGVSLAALGGLTALPLVYLIAGIGAAGETAEGGVGFRAVCVGAVAALAAVALVRVFNETIGGAVSVPLFQSYVLSGLVLGGSLALMLSSLAGGWSERGIGGPVAAFLRGAAVVLLGITILLAVAYFWRLNAVMGFVIGIAAGLFYSVLATAVSAVRVSAADLVLGVPLFAVTLVPAFISSTVNLTRDQKIHVMIWVLAGAALIVIATSSMRLILRARGAAAARSPRG